MPSTIPDDFKVALGDNISLNLALRMVRANGTVLAWTNADEDVSLPQLTVGQITVPATLYHSGDCSFSGDMVQSDDIRKLDEWEFTGFYGEAAQGDQLLESDVAKGFFKDARFTLIVFAHENFNWQLLRQRGIVGEDTLYKNRVVWKMKDLASLLQADVLEVTSPLSRARWGDPELSFFNLNGQTADGFAARITSAITSVDDHNPRRRFVLATTEDFPAQRFTDGTVTWLSGANAGYVAQVLDWDNASGTFLLAESAPLPIAAGDSVHAQIKAPLTFDEWMAFFGDGRYFAGEPQIPTQEKAAEVTRS